MSTPDGIPAFLVQQVQAAYGEDIANQIFDGYQQAAQRPTTLRANALKASADDVAAALDETGIPYEHVPWYKDAFVVDAPSERDVWTMDIYRKGGIYLQSLSSMLPPLALAPREGADILDMCAAPGGKTSQIAALTHGAAHICACELNVPRAEKLRYNMDKQGVTNLQIMRVDARKLDEFFSFDQVLLDAPCTGTGTVRAGDPKAEKRITQQLLSKVTRSQRALLDRGLTVLKRGGTLIYSTCSILPEENELMLASVLKRHRDCDLVPLDPQALAAAPDNPELALPCLPNGLEGTITVRPTRLFEGFFIAAIKKA